jgi:hypothetical protein
VPTIRIWGGDTPAVAGRYPWAELLMDWQASCAIDRDPGGSTTHVPAVDRQPMKELWLSLAMLGQPALSFGAGSSTPTAHLLIVGTASTLDNCA